MTIEEQSEIIEAYKMGEEIEIKSAYRDWTLLTFKYPTIYCFNFQDFDYRVKKKRWRAEKGKEYFFVGSIGVVLSELDENLTTDDDRYKFGNCFRTKEDAEKARELMKETLTKFHGND